MAFDQELSLYEETYKLVQLIRDVLMASGGAAPDLIASAWSVTRTLQELICDALRLRELETVIHRLRDAELAVDILRRDLYDMLRARLVSGEMFDEAMRGTTRCRAAVHQQAAATRHRAWARICGYEYRPRSLRAARA